MPSASLRDEARRSERLFAVVAAVSQKAFGKEGRGKNGKNKIGFRSGFFADKYEVDEDEKKASAVVLVPVAQKIIIFRAV